jgi:hypothetical protein
MLIQPLPEDPIVKNTTGKNKLNLDFVWLERLVVQYTESILESPKSPLDYYS